jgi:Flp pilus assembly pilin Flp
MRMMDRLLARLVSQGTAEEGQVLVEYALILAAIAVVCVALVSAIGLKVSTLYSEIATLFPLS